MREGISVSASPLPPSTASGQAVHYVFFTDGTITSIRYTKNYATTVSGDLPLEELKGIMDSLREVTA